MKQDRAETSPPFHSQLVSTHHPAGLGGRGAGFSLDLPMRWMRWRDNSQAASSTTTSSGQPSGQWCSHQQTPPRLLPHGQRPLFSRRLLQRQTIVMCDPRLHPITACRWRLHRCTRGRYDWLEGYIACTPLRRSVESHGGLARSLSTWAMPTNWTHHRLFLSMGPSPPNHKQFVS